MDERPPAADGQAGRARPGPIPRFDLYRELEIDPRASPATIEAAWRSLVKRHHPDVHGGRPAALVRTRRLNLAHDWLSDPALRAAYDAARRRRATRPARAGSSGPSTPAGARAARSTSSGAPATAGPRQPRVDGPREGDGRRAGRSPGLSASRLTVFLAACLAAIGVAYVASLLAVLLATFANLTVIVGFVIGAEATESILQLLGNLLYCGLAGFMMAASYRDRIDAEASEGPLAAVGAMAVLAVTLGFGAFTASYLPGFAVWLTTDAAGLPAFLIVGCIEGLLAGLLVMAVGLRTGGQRPPDR